MTETLVIQYNTPVRFQVSRLTKPIVRSNREGDPTLPDRCSLDVPQYMYYYPPYLKCAFQLLTLAFQNEFYKQKQGAVVGSPISSLVTALLAMWYQYVDDTMTKICEIHCTVSSFSDHLNSINPHIQSSLQRKKRMAEFHSWTPAFTW